MLTTTTSTGSTEPVILIVDNNAGVRQVLARMLAHLGSAPASATDTASAVAAAQARPQLALALIDLSLNGSDGVDTAQALRRLRPDLLIVLMSGNLTHLLAAQSQVGTPYLLRKPFSLSEIADLVALAHSQPSRLRERHV